MVPARSRLADAAVSVTAVVFPLPPRCRSRSRTAALSGFTQGVGYAVACVGPLLFGMLHTWTGGWPAPFALLLVALGVLLAGAWQACKPRMLEDTWN